MSTVQHSLSLLLDSTLDCHLRTRNREPSFWQALSCHTSELGILMGVPLFGGQCTLWGPSGIAHSNDAVAGHAVHVSPANARAAWRAERSLSSQASSHRRQSYRSGRLAQGESCEHSRPRIPGDDDDNALRHRLRIDCSARLTKKIKDFLPGQKGRWRMPTACCGLQIPPGLV